MQWLFQCLNLDHVTNKRSTTHCQTAPTLFIDTLLSIRNDQTGRSEHHLHHLHVGGHDVIIMDIMGLWAQQGARPCAVHSVILLIRLLYCSLTLEGDTLHCSPSPSLSLSPPVVLLLLVVPAGWKHGHFLLEGRREMQSAIQSRPLCSSADELYRVDNGLNYLSSSPPLLLLSAYCCPLFVLLQRYTDVGWRLGSLAAFHRSNFSN